MTNVSINNFSLFFLAVIPLAAAARIIHCLILITVTDDGEEASYKKRAKNALVFAIWAECISGFIHLISTYYS